MLALVLVLAATADVQQATRAYLDAYTSGDRAAILAVLDEQSVAYGSDAAEVHRGREQVMKMFDDDMKLWGKTARIGEMSDVSVAQAGALRSIFFQAPFSVGGRPPLMVRIAIVWERVRGGWKLRQSSSSVPTHGQSAAELLRQN
jgi:ketosteroid isomerase-like protein